MLQLSQKEKMLLQDQKNHEQLCVEKYTKYANEAQDSQLKQLFNSLASTEQQHLNTINQILSGQLPNLQQGQQGQQQAGGQGQQQFTSNQAGNAANKNDATLANDMLSTEKYISGTYDTTIFETANSQVRQALNHIQKEEQQHGESLFNYMQSKGMYQVQ